MEERNYNPLNEGYSGKKGCNGDDTSATQAPSTLSNIQSAVVDPPKPQSSPLDNSQGDNNE